MFAPDTEQTDSDFMSQENEANAQQNNPQQSIKAMRRQMQREKKKLKKRQMNEAAQSSEGLSDGPQSEPFDLTGARAAILQNYLPPGLLETLGFGDMSSHAGRGQNAAGRFASIHNVHHLAQNPHNRPMANAQIPSGSNPHGQSNQNPPRPESSAASKSNPNAVKPKKRKFDPALEKNDRFMRARKIMNMTPEETLALTVVITPENMCNKISSQVAEYVKTHLESLIFERVLEKRRIRIKHFTYRFGRIKVLCADEFSLDWLRAMVADMPLMNGMEKMRVWSTHEVPDVTKYTMFVQGFVSARAEQVYDEMKKAYKIRDDWIWFGSSWNKGTGRILKFGLTDEAVKCLEVDDMCPYVGVNQYVLLKQDDKTDAADGEVKLELQDEAAGSNARASGDGSHVEEMES